MVDFKYGQEKVKSPQGNFPHSGFKDALWIIMKPLKLESQNTTGRGGSIKIDRTEKGKGPTFKFLAPDNIAETVAHEWGNYDSMQSRLMEKYKSAMKLGEDVRAIKNIGVKKIISDISKGDTTGEKISSVIGNLNVGTNVVKAKVDTPLAYVTSNRRQWDLTFNMAAWSDPYKEIVKPVKELMKYSSPAQGKGQIAFEFPWIFKLSSEPGGLILADHAALTSVQPTWKAPYRNGFPTSCELLLVFMDLSPLFRNTIQYGGIINVIKPKIPEAKPIIKKPMKKPIIKKVYNQGLGNINYDVNI